MTYTLNNFDGSFFANVPDGTLNTSTSLTFVGKNYAGYGGILDENYLYLMQNFAKSTQPANAVTGQLWWNNNANVLSIYTGVTFKSYAGSTSSNVAPSIGNAVVGDLWYNTTQEILNVFTGTKWIAVGPSIRNGTGASTVTVDILPTGTADIIEFLVGNQIVAIISASTFTPATPIVGFGVIYSGFNLSSNIGGGGNLGGLVIGGPVSANGSYGQPGYVLTSSGNSTSSAYWAPSSGGGAGNIIISNTSANATMYPMFANIVTGNLATAFVSNTELTFNPNTGTLTSEVLVASGGITLNSNTITSAQYIPAGYNGVSSGPITIAPGANVIVAPGSNWSIV